MPLHGENHASFVAELVTLEQKAFSTPWGAEQYVAAFEQSSFLVFALRRCTEPATIVAYVALYHTLDEMEILNIAVDPQIRRQGLGYHLLHKTVQTARELGVERMVLEVRITNTPARNLYEKLGFISVGVRKKYYADTGEDACVYALAL